MVDKSINIVQITDPHLLAQDDMTHGGVYPNQNFRRLVDTLKTQVFDQVFFTGDISQDESEASYEYAAHELKQLNKPVYYIPGNHDDCKLMNDVFGRHEHMRSQRVLDVAGHRFIFLNSQKPGSASGLLSDAELQALKDNLASAGDRFINIIMHHHVAPVGLEVVDHYMLENREAFLQLIQQYPQVKLVMSGHVHGDYHQLLGNIDLETGPASCFQMNPSPEDRYAVLNQPGYKLYQFNLEGYDAKTFFLPE